jgi:hypothetical protein
MAIEERKEALLALRDSIERCLDQRPETPEEEALSLEIDRAVLRNPWFIPDHMRHSLSSLTGMLEEEEIERWIAPYRERMEEEKDPRSVLLIMAGNLPFVGTQDILAVLLFGHRAIVKPSSEDGTSFQRLLDLIASFPPFQDRIRVTDTPIGTPDAVIATGSDNSGRYFDHYFGHLPHTFRGDRSGVAILRGDEDRSELVGLLQDIFLYFGRGCRNVSKLYVPQGWDPDPLLGSTDEQAWLKEHPKYMNNYAYHKAIYLMNGERFYDGGTLLLKKDASVIAPLGVLFYEEFEGEKDLEERLERDAERIQCIVSRERIPFGKGQFPRLGEHEADKDPLKLLAEL